MMRSPWLRIAQPPCPNERFRIMDSDGSYLPYEYHHGLGATANAQSTCLVSQNSVSSSCPSSRAPPLQFLAPKGAGVIVDHRSGHGLLPAL